MTPNKIHSFLKNALANWGSDLCF